MVGVNGVVWFDPAGAPVLEPVPGWCGRFLSTAHVTFGFWEVTAGAPPVHEHEHPEEEVWTVVEGQLAVTVGDEERVVGSGGAVVIPGGVRHRVQALGAARAITCDHPVRTSLPGAGRRNA